MNIVLAILVGGISGFAAHLIANKQSILLPRKGKTKWYWGFLADIFIGSLAAVLAVTYLVPDVETTRNVIGVSILAGIGGESVLLRRTLDKETHRNEKLNDINNRLKGEIDNNDN